MHPILKKLSDFRMSREDRKRIADTMLTPFSWLYGFGVWVRNKMFDMGALKQQKFDVPVISVGNIAVGGTGKTPHVEFIIEALRYDYHIGVLSRGYKRQTQGFVMANSQLSHHELGDEPYQIYRKFGDSITLAVCEKRVDGINEMLKIDPNINLILLDDAFQHRYVTPKVNIVLCDYHRPPFDDKLMPLGRLREPFHNILRSDMVVVTKCPDDIKPRDFRIMKKGLDLYPAQDLCFSTVRYGSPQPVFADCRPVLTSLDWLTENDYLLGVTGIAQPLGLVKYLKSFKANVKVVQFDDHHEFSREDFDYLVHRFNKIEAERKFIITTEKDAARIINNPYFPHSLRDSIYYIPIKIKFLSFEGEDFLTQLVKRINYKPIEYQQQ